MRAGAAVVGVSLRRVARDRTALFFLVVMPIVVILLVGATVRGFSTFRIGVVDLGSGVAGRSLTAALERAPGLEVHRYPDLAAVRSAVGRAEMATAVVLPRGMDADLRAGRPVRVEVLAERANSAQQAAASAVGAVVAAEGGRVQAAVFTSSRGLDTYDRALGRAAGLQPTVARVEVRNQSVDSRADTLPEGFGYSAPTMLVLFVFLNAVASGAALIETRRVGMHQRMRAAPVRPSVVVAAETLSYFLVAAGQAGLIVLVGRVVFGVSWGDPPAAALLVIVWALVGAGAGVLAGTLFRTPEQAGAIGPALGIVLAMLGGCMWPLSIVSGVMRTIGHLTPHAWAVDAWTDLLSRRGSLSSIAPNLGILAGFAVVLLVVSSARLRRVMA